MTIINSNSITGINSITAQASALNFYDADGNQLKLSAEINPGTGASISSPASNVLTLGTNNSERVRIDSSGLVGIGTNIPGSYDSSGRTLVLDQNSTLAGMTIRASTQGAIYFADGLTGNEAYRGRIEYSHSDDALNFGTAGTGSKLTLDSSGRLLVGTSSTYDAAGDDLVVASSGDTGITIATTGAGSSCSIHFADGSTGVDAYRGNLRYDHSTNNLSYSIGDTHAWTTDVSQRFLLGDETAVTNLKFGGSGDFGSRQYVYGANQGFNNGLAILNYDETASIPAILKLGTSRNDTVGINSIVGNSGDNCVSIQFMGNDGTRFIDLARIDAVTDNDVGTNDMPGRLSFFTTKNGNSVVSERFRINNFGRPYVITESDGPTVSTTQAAGTSDNLFIGRHSGTVGTPDSGTLCILVATNGNVTNTNDSYGAISDIKLKENIVDADSQWDDFKAVRFRKYNFKEETGHETFTQLGVIAQEIETVCPGLVSETPDRDQDGNDLGTTTKSVKYSILTKKALVALQEAMTRIEELEAKVAALEAQ